MAAAVDPLPPPPNRAPLDDSLVAKVSTVFQFREIIAPPGYGIPPLFSGIAVAPSGNVYISYGHGSVILQIDQATREVTTLAGSTYGYRDDVGDAAQFCEPSGIAVAPSGIVYVVDTRCHVIRRIDPVTREVTTLAGSVDGFADGVGAAARFDRPEGIAIAPSGIIYVADTGNNMIRRIDPVTREVTTLAGSREGVGYADGRKFVDGVGAAARFDRPTGIAVAPSGVVYVADTGNYRIRQLDPTTGAVTTLAGSVKGFADGVGAAARFGQPTGIAVAPSGMVYVADTGNDRIRQLDPATGAVMTVVGPMERVADGVRSTVWFKTIAMAPSGVLCMGDSRHFRLLIMTLRANPGLVHMARKAVVNGTSKFGALPEHIVGDIFSYVGNTRGPGGGVHLRRADPDAAAQSEAFRARLLAERGAAAEGNVNLLGLRDPPVEAAAAAAAAAAPASVSPVNLKELERAAAYFHREEASKREKEKVYSDPFEGLRKNSRRRSSRRTRNYTTESKRTRHRANRSRRSRK